MRRAAIAVMVVGAAVIAGALLWPDRPPDPPPGRAKERPRTVQNLVNEHGEAAPPPKAVAHQVVRVRLMGPKGPVTEATASLYLASGYSHHGRRLASARGEPDAQGWVTFDRAPGKDDAPELQVFAPYFEFHEGPFEDGATVTLTPLAPIRGRVLMPDGSPASGAIVGNEDEPYVKTAAGADGAFELVVPMRRGLIAERDGLWGRGTEVIVLGPGLGLNGAVAGRDGTPLGAVEVTLKAGALSRAVLTDEGGRWSATVFRDGRTLIGYRKAGYHPVMESVLALNQRNGAPLVMSRPSSVVGTLVASDGQPVAGAIVRASDALDAVTDEGGGFTYEEVAVPELTLEAETEDGVARKTIAVPEGTTVTVTLMLPPELIDVPLDVVDAVGEPNFNWEAVATPVPAKGWESHAAYGAREKLGLTQGRFQISVKDVDRELSGGTTIDASPAVDARPIRIVLYGADGGRGKRLEGDRDPIAKVKVLVVTATGAPAVTAQVECGGVPGRSLGGGAFECPFYEDEHGAIVVTAEADGAQGSAAVSMGDQDVKLTVRANRIIEGKITGTLPPNAYLEINSTAEMAEEPVSANTFVLEGRPAVRTIVCVVAGGANEPVARGCAVAAPEGDVKLEIPLGPPGQLSLAVVDERGKPVPDPLLYLDRRGLRPLTPDGKVSLAVAPGTHVLVVNAQGSKARAELLFGVKPGAPVDLGTVRLK